MDARKDFSNPHSLVSPLRDTAGEPFLWVALIALVTLGIWGCATTFPNNDWGINLSIGRMPIVGIGGYGVIGGGTPQAVIIQYPTPPPTTPPGAPPPTILP
jgi:hypothetical protein